MRCGMLEKSRISGLRSRALRLLAVMLLAGSLLARPLPPVYGADDLDEEVKIGREAAEQVAKESKFTDNAALAQRVEAIGSAIAKVAVEREVPAAYGKSTLAKFNYSFKVIEDKDVNAFALPGGFIYVNTGLFNFVHSDDELAGVIAHEIAHVAHHHAMHFLKVQQRQMLGLAVAVLVGAAAGASGEDLGGIAYLANLINIARLSDYGMDAEFDADRTAVAYLAETKYNPVGILTLMERLAREELRKPEVNLGILATHPPSYKRAPKVLDELNKRAIPINRRLVTKYLAVEIKPIENSQAYSVWIADTEVIRLADADGERAAARAERVAKKLGSLLLAGARFHDVKVGGGGQYVVVMNEVLVSPTPEDAKLAGTSVNEVVTSAANAIKKALLKERLG
ncbi:MAG TPA: M48 family metalloprotease [Armatimonadota bacterium]|nr:M48 family metalloprotease [Armatimonadota bacterium]